MAFWSDHRIMSPAGEPVSGMIKALSSPVPVEHVQAEPGRGWLGRQGLLYIYRLACMRMTGPLQRVLRAFLEDLPAPRYGYDLMKAAGVKSGTLYPLLGRLEEDGLVSSGWAVPQMAGQRPRRYYRLTGEGATVARVELARLSAGGRAPARPGRPAPGSLG